MPPITTIPTPVQNSHQVGPMGSAIPPTMKPTMMMETAAYEAGRPWNSSWTYDGPICASSPCAPVSPVPATAPDAA